jgi:hypothetical protein
VERRLSTRSGYPKEKMVTAPILVFPDWEKTFHVHVDASAIALGAILVQPGAGDLDHPIAFASQKAIRIRTEL